MVAVGLQAGFTATPAHARQPDGLVSTAAGTPPVLNFPSGVALDQAGGYLYVADSTNNRIRRFGIDGSAVTIAGDGVAGFANGPGATARFNFPRGIAVFNGDVYVADYFNQRVRKIDLDGTVTTVAGTGSQGSADGPAGTATFNSPFGLAVDSGGNLYVSDSGANKIRKISAAGMVSTFAGTGAGGSTDGPGANATFGGLAGLAVDQFGNVYVADAGNRKIRVITSLGDVSTLAGSGASGSINGPATTATFSAPSWVAVTTGLLGNPTVYVSEFLGHRIRRIQGGTVSTVSGTGAPDITDGPSTTASFNQPSGLALNNFGEMYVADSANNRIRKLDPTGYASTFAGLPQMESPAGVAGDANGNLYIADRQNHRIMILNTAGSLLPFAGSGTAGSADGPSFAASFSSPNAVFVDDSGDILVADSGNNKIRKITPGGLVSTVAGTGAFGATDGPAATASFATPKSVSTDAAGNIYVADNANNKIRKISGVGGSATVSTFAGTGGTGSADGSASSATFNQPYAAAVDRTTGAVYVTDFYNHKIRKISGGVVSTFAGTTAGSTDGPVASAKFYYPTGLAIDGNFIYVADSQTNKIRRIQAGVVTTLAGTGATGFVDGPGNAATFHRPLGLGMHGGSLAVADSANNLIRDVVLNPAGPDTTPPAIAISAPTSGQVLGSSPVALSGVASDDIGVTSVTVAIYRNVSGGQYWNGTGWQGPATTVPTTLGTPGAFNTTWSYNFNAPPGGVFTFAALAYDAASNYSFAPWQSFAIADAVAPTITLTSPTPSQAFNARPVTITGNASDNVGVGDVQVAIYRPTEAGQFWNGTAWQVAYTTVTATLATPGATTTTYTYNFNPPQAGGYFYAAAIALDTSYKYSLTPFTLVTLPDTVAPTAAVTTPVAGTTTGALTITGTATDNVAVNRVGIAIYRASTGLYWNGTAWQAGFATIPATLATPGDPTTTYTRTYTPPGPGTYYIGAVPSDGNYNYTITPFTIITHT
jgi:sugar lactone lactonase YvrE